MPNETIMQMSPIPLVLAGTWTLNVSDRSDLLPYITSIRTGERRTMTRSEADEVLSYGHVGDIERLRSGKHMLTVYATAKGERAWKEKRQKDAMQRGQKGVKT